MSWGIKEVYENAKLIEEDGERQVYQTSDGDSITLTGYNVTREAQVGDTGTLERTKFRDHSIWHFEKGG